MDSVNVIGIKNIFRSFVAFIVCLFILLIEGCGQMPTEDLQNLTLPSTNNYYLICPKGFCNVQPNEYTPIYNVSAEDLFNAWNQMLAKQLYVNIIGTIPAKAQYIYVQKSQFFGFPDYITVQFIAVSDNSSTLAVYSRSRYGLYDFGINKKRLQSWIAQLNQIVQNMPPSTAPTNTAEQAPEDTNVKNLDKLIVPQSSTGIVNAPGNTNSSGTVTGTDNTSGGGSVTNTDNTSAAGTATSTDNTSGAPSTTTDNSTATGNINNNSTGNTTTDNTASTGAVGTTNS